MATQGPLYPGTTANESVGATLEDKDAWLNPANIGDADADEATIVAATYDSPDISQRLKATNFGFTIPTGSTIDGITVEVNRRSIVLNSGKDFRVQLLDAAGALVGTNKAVPATIWPTAAATATYGGAADTWTASPTVAMVNNALFGVALSCQANIANADVGVAFIRVTVTYTPPAFSTFERAMAIDGVGAVASVGTFFSILEATTALVATGAIETSGVRLAPPIERSAAIAATGAVQTAGQRDLLRSTSLIATGAVQTAPQRDLQRQVGVTATGTVTTAGQVESGVVTHQRSAALSATGAITTAGTFWSILERAVALSAIGTIATAARRDLLRTVTIAATGAVTASGEVDGIAARSVALTATGLIVTDSERVLVRSAAIGALAAITVTPEDVGGNRWAPSTDSRWPLDTQAHWMVTTDLRWPGMPGSRWPLIPELNW